MALSNPICFLKQTITLGAVVLPLSTLKEFGPEDFRNVAGDIKTVQIVLEPNAAAVAGAVLARYWQTGEDPTLTEGMPIRAFEKVNINSFSDVIAFRIKAVDALEHKLQIQFFNY
ncbi:hypothetical protein [Pedobacter cryophilus]|uniref:Uncharacterized protein n=1 Tax=Pedobacter cryophilus TaxID=2571271 RepID=A0A4U1BVM0_9SPHI|nr:hypothetical protein [Pedobacter cryophilus]TKB96845.1 hypothetical protein FA046_12260 [Pedobacter cryophilus]